MSLYNSYNHPCTYKGNAITLIDTTYNRETPRVTFSVNFKLPENIIGRKIEVFDQSGLSLGMFPVVGAKHTSKSISSNSSSFNYVCIHTGKINSLLIK